MAGSSVIMTFDHIDSFELVKIYSSKENYPSFRIAQISCLINVDMNFFIKM